MFFLPKPPDPRAHIPSDPTWMAFAILAGMVGAFSLCFLCCWLEKKCRPAETLRDETTPILQV